MPMPDTREEAAGLCFLLDLGLYLTCEAFSEQYDPGDQREIDPSALRRLETG